jgi:two-component system, OmpR family, phosphate regulon sensor histidine kinase PhoR
MENSEDIIGNLKREILELNNKLAASESLKSHFISNVTNEIVNPFASILALSSQILAAESFDCQRLVKMAGLIHSETFHLDFQLRNIFAAAKIEAGDVCPQPAYILLGEVIESICELFKLEAGKKNVFIDVSYSGGAGPQTKWLTDPDKLKLVLINFMHNAIKFTKKQTEIKISVSIENERLKFKITDQGIGISPDEKSSLFDRFKTFKSGINTAYRGNGLGLSINMAMADVLEGTINVDSSADGGAVFTFAIPELQPTEQQSSCGCAGFFSDDELIF